MDVDTVSWWSALWRVNFFRRIIEIISFSSRLDAPLQFGLCKRKNVNEIFLSQILNVDVCSYTHPSITKWQF
jgi:hypothetical protein